MKLATRTKTTYETPLPEPAGHNFFRAKAQRGELMSEAGNVAVVYEAGVPVTPEV